MNVIRITKRTVDQALPTDRTRTIWDQEFKGFGVRISPKGRKLYFVQFRLFRRRGRSHRISIGTHGVLTADQARMEAKRILGEVAAGRDPRSPTNLKMDTLTVSQAFERYLSEHVDVRLKKRTAEEYRRAYRLHILPQLGKVEIDAVSRADIERLHSQMRHVPTQANRTLSVAGACFSWLETAKLISPGSNPCRGIRKLTEGRRERFLSLDELRQLHRALENAEAAGMEWPSTIRAIRLLIFTGARKSEIVTLRWSYVDLKNRRIRLPDSKTGPKTIYLPAEAIRVLEAADRVADNPYVCPGKNQFGHLVGLNKAWSRIRRSAGLEDVRIHDLRHTFASIAIAQGQSLQQVGALLGHRNPQTTARYAHLTEEGLHAAASIVGRALSSSFT